MTQIDREKPVMVSGATGYVAGWIVKKLLDEGLTVHAAVRDPGNAEKLKYLNALAEKSEGTIKYFKSDLLDEGSYAEAMEGCELVYHTASPFTMEVKDAQKELIEPAMLGTRNVLEQASKTESVKRVVVTSSYVAIFGDNVDVKDTPRGVFDEEVWNTTSSIDHMPYAYSKVLAEKEGWRVCGEQNRWDMVTINPAFVIGPGINPFGSSESFSLIKMMGDGTLKTGAPRYGVGVVDVRDVAEAHYKAGFMPEAKGRYMVVSEGTDFVEMTKALLPKYGDDYAIPRRALPKWLVWLVGPLVDKMMTRKLISKNVNVPWLGDNRKSKEELGLTYRPMAESMCDFFEQLVEYEVIKKA
ncbi:NAD-dependent epimerase/dehydratase family protein [Planctomycetota bacterium]|nr:NAD-dependent epimerase/dehydratase family protein [Planctomycetota bacterium]